MDRAPARTIVGEMRVIGGLQKSALPSIDGITLGLVSGDSRSGSLFPLMAIEFPVPSGLPGSSMERGPGGRLRKSDGN